MEYTAEQNKLIQDGISQMLKDRKSFVRPKPIRKHQMGMINFLLEENYLGMNEHEKNKIRAACSDLFYKFNQNKAQYFTECLGVFCLLDYNPRSNFDSEQLIMLKAPSAKMYIVNSTDV